ncbi:MAG: glycosyltransferase family 61 protein [Sulfitobacter sp.]
MRALYTVPVAVLISINPSSKRHTEQLRNKIELSFDPEEMFFNPWRDEGLKLLRKPEFIWREIPSAKIEGFAVSDHDEINKRIRSFVSKTMRHRSFSKAVEVNLLPAVVDKAEFRKSTVLARGKMILSGASGTRLLNAYRWENEDADFDPEEKLHSYFEKCQKDNSGRKLPVEEVFLENDLDLGIACRNTFNFFHFIVESLSQLTILDDVGFQGNIMFHYPNSEEKRRPFAESFVAALFPEYAGRVFFQRAPKAYDLVMTAFDFNIALGQAPDGDAQLFESLTPQARESGLDLSGMEDQQIFEMNSVSSGLLALRRRALKAIESQDFSYLPKRFFVGRDNQSSRRRPMDGEEGLLDHLTRFGFAHVDFEKLSPLEQIAIMAQAEVMVSVHGAGFTNMLFANPDAFVIELGTVQTARYRWKEFWPLAHAAQCNYLTFFADYNDDDPFIEPKFEEHGILPVRLSEKAIAQVVSFIVTILGETPLMPNAKFLSQLARRVLRAGKAENAIALLQAHQDMVKGDVPLCLLLADCHKELGETKSELVALNAAYAADPQRWQTLIRIFWCASNCERPQVVRWALSTLERDFPDRHKAFVANHDWIRFVA